MLNIKIKNSIYNNVISFLKANNIRYETRKKEDGTEKVHFFPKSNQQKNQLATQICSTFNLFSACGVGMRLGGKVK